MPTHFKGTPEQVHALNTFIKFTRASDSLDRRLRGHRTFGDLSPSQFGVLETLYHLGPQCQRALADKLLKSGGNMTLVIDNLEKRGLAQRQPHADDRRMASVSLTEAGEALIGSLFPEHVAVIVEEFSVLSPTEQEQLGALCRKLGKGREDLD